MVGQFLGSIWGFFENLFAAVLQFLANLFGYLFDGLITVLKALFKPILILVALIFYFVYKLAELFVQLLDVLLSIGKLIYSFVMGLFRTISGITWTPTTPTNGSWNEPIGEVFTALQPYQLDRIAYILLFAIWIMTAIAAIKILSGRGGK